MKFFNKLVDDCVLNLSKLVYYLVKFLTDVLLMIFIDLHSHANQPSMTVFSFSLN